jgi:hypothetical protein
MLINIIKKISLFIFTSHSLVNLDNYENNNINDIILVKDNRNNNIVEFDTFSKKINDYDIIILPENRNDQTFINNNNLFEYKIINKLNKNWIISSDQITNNDKQLINDFNDNKILASDMKYLEYTPFDIKMYYKILDNHIKLAITCIDKNIFDMIQINGINYNNKFIKNFIKKYKIDITNKKFKNSNTMQSYYIFNDIMLQNSINIIKSKKLFLVIDANLFIDKYFMNELNKLNIKYMTISPFFFTDYSYIIVDKYIS